MTSTELGYLSGVTSNIQTQLDGKVSNYSIEFACYTKSWYKVAKLKHVAYSHSYILEITTRYSYNTPGTGTYIISIGYYNAFITQIGSNNIGEQPISCVCITNPTAANGTVDIGVYYNGSTSGNVIYLNIIPLNNYSVDFSSGVSTATIASTDIMAALEHRARNVASISYHDQLPSTSTANLGEMVLIPSS